MAAAEVQTSPQTAQDNTWHGIVLASLKRNEISLVPYVPDRVLTTLIKNLHADPFFMTLVLRAGVVFMAVFLASLTCRRLCRRSKAARGSAPPAPAWSGPA